MTMAVASKVSQADNDKHKVKDQLLGHGPGIQTIGTTAFDHDPTSIEAVVPFA